MINKQLSDYINRQAERGVKKDDIKNALTAQGWTTADIDEALGATANTTPSATPTVTPSTTPSMPTAPKITPNMPATPQATPNMPSAPTITPTIPTVPTQPPATLQPEPIQATPSEPQSVPISVQNVYTPPPEISTTKKSKGKIIAIIGVVVAILVLAGGAFAYVYYFQNLPTALVMKKMQTALATVKSAEYSMTATINIPKPPDAIDHVAPIAPMGSSFDGDLTIDISGTGDSFDAKNPMSSTSLKFKLANSSSLKQDINIGIEVKAINQIVYARINELPDLSALSPVAKGIDLSFITDQWVKIDQESLTKELGQFNLGEMTQAAQQQQLQYTQKLEQLQKSINIGKLVSITEKLPDESIDGTNSYHYKYEMSKDGLKNTILEITKAFADTIPQTIDATQLDQALSAQKLPQGEIWIGRTDFLPHKLTIESTVSDPSTPPVSLDITMAFKNYNKHLTVNAPEQYKSLEEIIGGFMINMLGATNSLKNSATTTPDASSLLDSDNDGLANVEEAKYGADPNNPDSDSDGYPDGQEVTSGYNPMGSGLLPTSNKQ